MYVLEIVLCYKLNIQSIALVQNMIALAGKSVTRTLMDMNHIVFSVFSFLSFLSLVILSDMSLKPNQVSALKKRNIVYMQKAKCAFEIPGRN